MKKVSVYFTDRQAAALEKKAAEAGITFAEALRRALDEWLAPPTQRPLTFADGSPVSPRSPTAAAHGYGIKGIADPHV
jgi:Ribbon-helix-helix protein, copG family